MSASTSTASTASTSGTGRRAGLDHDEIVDRALALVEAGGAEALTMRKLASELDVTTTTIYWHVGGRDELIVSLIRRLSDRQAVLEIDGATPRERVMCVARHVWTSALAHRNVTSLAHQAGATSLLEMPLERALARELDAAGVRGEAGRDALRAILMCVAGFLVVAFRSERDAPAGIDVRSADRPRIEPQALWAEVTDADIDPSTIAALCEHPDLPSLFEFTVGAVVSAFVPEQPGSSGAGDG